jgi:predicted nucleic-acid-binding protein
VLSRRLKSPKPDVIAALRDLAAIPGIVLEQPGTVQRALSMWEQGPADFADYVQLDVARSAGARSLVTFDRDLLKSEDTRAPARR